MNHPRTQDVGEVNSNLSNDDGDVNRDGKKAIGLDWKNNYSARASRFFVHFFVVAVRYTT